jgi:hypothetical protein
MLDARRSHSFQTPRLLLLPLAHPELLASLRALSFRLKVVLVTAASSVLELLALVDRVVVVMVNHYGVVARPWVFLQEA